MRLLHTEVNMVATKKKHDAANGDTQARPRCAVCDAALEVVTIEEVVTHWVWQNGWYVVASRTTRCTASECLSCGAACADVRDQLGQPVAGGRTGHSGGDDA